MRDLQTLFTHHPGSVGESYGEHLVSAGSFALRLALAASACAIHAVLPFLCEKTGSRLVTELHDRMVAHRIGEKHRRASSQTV